MVMGDWHPMPPGAAHYFGTPSTRFGTFYWNAGRAAADYRFKKETKAYSVKLAREQRKKNRREKSAFVRKVVGRVKGGLMKVLKKVGRVKKRRAAKKREGKASTGVGDGTGWSRLGKVVLDGLMVPAAIVGRMVFPSVDIRRGGSASVEKDGAGDATTPGAAAAKNPDTKKEETDKPAATVATPEGPENTILSTITTLETGTTVAAGTATASTPTTNKISYMSPTPTILNSPSLPQIITTPPSTSTIDNDEGEEDPDAITPVRVHRLGQQIPTGIIDLGDFLEDPDSGNTTTTPTNRSSSGANTTVTNPPMYPPGSTIVPVTITPAGAAQMAQEQQEREQGQQGQQGVKRQRSKLQKKRSVKDKGRKAKDGEKAVEKDVTGVTDDVEKIGGNGDGDGDEKEKAEKNEKCLPVNEWLKREKVRGNAIQALKPKKSLRKEIMKVFKQGDA